ncbi:amidase [Aspergillus varians]
MSTSTEEKGISPPFQEQIKAALSIRDNSLPASSILPTPPPTDLLDVTDIPRSCGLLSEWELEVTEYDATALVDGLAAQKYTAVDLLNAFRKRASIAHQLTNCLTELLPEALEQAEAADAYIRRTGQTLGPLHGLPVSFKEQIAVAGHITNAGFVAWADRPTSKDANLVASFKSLGAIPFARTNQPQSFMHLETSNNIYGATVHPKNRSLTAGGSSGGETALMALGGTPLGLGGDIGGSIRCPAALNSLWGFKPSVGRISGGGVVVPWPGCDSIHGTLGPFAKSLRDIDLLQRVYSQSKPWLEDPSILPYAVSISDAAPLNRPLRVGIMANDGNFNPLPPVQLIIEDVTKKLKASPLIQVREFTPFNHEKAWQVISANYFEDGGATIEKICAESGEALRPLTAWMIEECKKNEALIHSTPQGRKAARDEFRALYSAHWNAAAVDVVVAPVTPSVAPPLDTSRYWPYTAVWNLLDYPGLAFPASDMIGGYSKDLKSIPYVPKTPSEEYIFSHYDPEIAQKLPVGLQVVAQKWHDSECLAAAQIIERALRE